MKYIISVDAGKSATKALGRKLIDSTDREVFFLTKSYDLADGDIDVEGNSYKVSYQGKNYIIGEQGEHYDTDTTKTSLTHQLAIYTAICKIAGRDTTPYVTLTVGCPTAIFKNVKLKEEFREFIAPETPVEISVNGLDYKITFERVIIKHEGSGITYLEPAVFRNNRVVVIDIGRRNMNVGVYDNLVPIPSTLFSNNYGGIFLETMVREELSTYFGDDYDLKTAAKAIENGGIIINGKLQEESAVIVCRTINRYIKNNVLTSIKEKNINLSIMPVICVGGTSKIIYDYFKKSVPHVQLPKTDAQWANAKGFQIVGLVKAGVL